jgi:predicted amidohydrolase
MTTPLRIAAAQFPVSGNTARNRQYIDTQMAEAASKGVQVLQFPETALPGYAPKHIGSLENYAWSSLDNLTQSVREAAARLKLWVVLGSMRQVDGDAPRSCVLVISDTGEIAGTYDKQRLYGREREFYSVGTGPCVVDIGGYKCGFLICYDNCFPELYDEYRDLEVGLIFHSFYNAANSQATSIEDLMLANLIVRAADNRMWISASNSSERYSPLSACIVRPDGTLVRSKRNVAGIVIDDYPSAELGWTYDNRTA